MIDRVTASLGIHAASIKMVHVYEGSLVIQYDIVENPREKKNIQEIKKIQTEMFATNQIDLGAPILDMWYNDTKIIQEGVVVAKGYDPIRVANTSVSREFFYKVEDDIDVMFENSTIINRVKTSKD
jgi:hypothetical protein